MAQLPVLLVEAFAFWHSSFTGIVTSSTATGVLTHMQIKDAPRRTITGTIRAAQVAQYVLVVQKRTLTNHKALRERDGLY